MIYSDYCISETQGSVMLEEMVYALYKCIILTCFSLKQRA